MKLIELDPHWVLISRWDDPDGQQHYTLGDASQRHGGGISFECPVHTQHCVTCGQKTNGSHRIVVWFENPIDGLPPEATAPHRWIREGETFETLTLSPSINVQVADPTCWHGFIKAGEIQ